MNLTAYDIKQRPLYIRHVCDRVQAFQTVINSPYHAQTEYIIFRGRKYTLNEIKNTIQPSTERGFN